MKNFNRLSIFILLLISSFVYADDTPPCPGCPGGNTGGVGPGKEASPIDMYVYILAIVAILFIVHFAKKYRAQKSIN